MSFLSLAGGDPAARELLQRAVKARYGVRPLMLDNARLCLSLREPGVLPVTAILNAYYRAPHQARLEITRRILFVNVSKTVEAFDGTAIYRDFGKGVTRDEGEPMRTSIRRYIWAVLCLMLTPLTQQGITLKSEGENGFAASNGSYPGDVGHVTLNADDTVQRVRVQRHRLADGKMLAFDLIPHGGLITYNDLPVPKQVEQRWEDGLSVTYTVTDAQPNPPDDPPFTL